MTKNSTSEEKSRSDVKTLQKKLKELTLKLLEKEFEYNALFENTNDALFIIDLETEKYLKVNQKAIDMLGYSQEEMMNHNFYDITAPEERLLGEERIKILRNGKKLPNYERTFIRKNGKRFVGEINASIIYDKDDNELYLQSIVRDISHRKHIEEELRDSQEKHRILLDQSLLGFVIFSTEGEVLFVNDLFIEIFELKSGFIKNKNAFDYLHFFQQENIANIEKYFKLIQTNTHFSRVTRELEIKLESGSKWILVNLIPIKIKEGNALAATVSDITDRKSFEKNLIKERGIYQQIADISSKYVEIKPFSEEILKVLLETLDFDFGAVQLIFEKENKKMIEAAAIVGLHEELEVEIRPRPITDTSYLSAYVMRKKKILYVPDIKKVKLPKKVLTRLKVFNVQAIISWPMIGSDNDVIGTIQLFKLQPKEILDDEKIFFESVTKILTTSFESLIAQRMLGQSEEKFRTFVEQSLVGVGLMYTDGKFFFNNEATSLIFEKTDLEIMGSHLTDLLNIIDKEKIKIIQDYLLKIQDKRTFEAFQVEVQHLSPDLNSKWLAMYLTPIVFQDEMVFGCVFVDITFQKLFQIKLERERKTYQMITDATIHIRDIPKFTQRLLEGLIEIWGFDSGSVRLFDVKEKALIPVASFGLSGDAKESLSKQFVSDPEFHLKSIIGKSIYIPDITLDDTLTFTKELRQQNYRSYLSWPMLTIDNRLLGSIQLGSRNLSTIPKNDIAIFDTLTGIIATSIERLMSVEELTVSQEQFKRTVDTVLDGLLIIEKGKVIYSNDRACEIYGFTHKQLRKLKSFDFIAPEDDDLFTLKLESDDTYSQQQLEYWITRKDGSRKFVNTRTSIETKDDLVQRIYIVTSDITERKLAEDNLRRFNEELEFMVKERTEQMESVIDELEAFSYSVSHDLRSPLRGINGFSKILLDEYANNLDDIGQNYLLRIRTATIKMGQLIDDLLNLSRISRSEMKSMEIDLSEYAYVLFEEIIENYPERKFDFSVEPNVSVIGDPKLIRIVLSNLLENAIKFTSMRAISKIHFGSEIKNEEKVFFVRDNGIGFDMKFERKLFKAFQRLHGPEEFEGTGIGLATVLRIINRHNGRIWAEGIANEGATFYFTVNVPNLVQDVLNEKD